MMPQEWIQILGEMYTYYVAGTNAEAEGASYALPPFNCLNFPFKTNEW